MSARFRLRTPQGQELSFASQAVFVEFVRSGDLAPEDLVYDGETHEWAPARTHPLVLEIQYEREESATSEDTSTTEAEPDADTTEPPVGDEAGGLDGFGLELAPPTEGLSPEEEAAAFLRKMEAERAMDLDDASGQGRFGIVMEDSSSLGGMISERSQPEPTLRPPEEALPRPSPAPGEVTPGRRKAPPPASSAPSAGRKPATGGPQPVPGRGSTTHSRRAAPTVERSHRAERRKPRKAARKAARPAGAGAARGALRVVLLLVVAGVVAVGAYFVVGSMDAPAMADPVEATDPPPPAPEEPRPTPAVEPQPTSAPPTPARVPTIPATPEALAARAQERFLTTTQGLLRELEPIPETWLSGAYFALPSDHPRVRTTWQEYLETARRVRDDEEARYRTAYERALDEAAVEGETREIRLADGMETFAAGTEARIEHWGRVEALALAAIRSHDALVQAEGLIMHDPAGVTGRPQGIGAGVTGRDSDTELLLSQVIDLVGSRLSADGLGPREGSNVRAWVWGGFLDAVTY